MGSEEFDLNDIDWVECKPGDFRKQSSVILKATRVDPKDSKETAKALEALESIDAWITTAMKNAAEDAKNTLEEQIKANKKTNE